MTDGTSKAPFIFCDGLVKVHRVANLEVLALQGLDLSVERGEIVGVIGSSGSGKSSLLNVLGGLDRATAGRCVVNGQDLFKMSDAALTRYRREGVGFVWQQGARNLLHYMDAANNVALPMQLAGMAAGKISQRVAALLDLVGLTDRKQHNIRSMSGGEQQRLSIAVALANNPPLLLADEPTGELDSANAARVYQAFENIREKFRVTVLIVSHDRNIARHCDRVLGIQDGKVASETNLAMQGESRQMLDSAGRLQIPKALREQFGIGQRVRLVPGPDGLVIQATQGEEAA